MREGDGIVIGAGHNGLILQAYAAMAGLDVIALERRDSAGGGLQTVEDPRLPGFRHNTHAFFHRAVDKLPWYRDLELARHGCRYIEPGAQRRPPAARRPHARMVARFRQDGGVPGAGHYRGHLDGLYLCGSCCHPGGNITGLPACNAAQVALRDLGMPADWMPEGLERRLARV